MKPCRARRCSGPVDHPVCLSAGLTGADEIDGQKTSYVYLDANGFGRTVVTTDTILRGIFGLERAPSRRAGWNETGYIVNLYAHLRDFYDRLSYVADWREAFCQSPRLDVEVCNINNLVHFANCLLRIRRYDLVVISHAALGDDVSTMRRAAPALARRRCPMLVFVGNEYDLLDDKIAFMQEVGAERVCSQLPLAAAKYLYHGVQRIAFSPRRMRSIRAPIPRRQGGPRHRHRLRRRHLLAVHR